MCAEPLIKEVIRFSLRRCVLLLLLLLAVLAEAQTSVNMSVASSDTLDPQLLLSYTVRDPGGSEPGSTQPELTVTNDGNYQPNCDSWMLVRLPHDYIKVRGVVEINDENDYLEFYEGADRSTAVRLTHRDRMDTSITLDRYDRIDTVVQDCLSGYLWIHFVSNGFNQSAGFRLALYCCPSGDQIYDVQFYNASDTALLLTWQDSSDATYWVVQHSWDGIAFDVRHLDTVYSKCNLLKFSDYPADSIPSFFHIFNNRRALLCLGLCTSETYHYCVGGNWHNPADYYYENGCYVTTNYSGWAVSSDVYPCGPPRHHKADADSNCHTFIFDTTMHDENTCGLLRCVPPGGTQSVRQGGPALPDIRNKYNCTFVVDTNACNLLVLRYVVVMKRGCTRAGDSMPYFRLSVGSSRGSAMNDCYYQTYYGNDSTLSTWHHCGDVYWTDWQTMAIDLRELHGLEEHIVLQTRKCIDGAHWCYAYLNVENGLVDLPSTDCTGANETFVAPPDFSYVWQNMTGDTVCRNRIFSPNIGGTYVCNLLYHGHGDTLCNPTQLYAYSGQHYPVARYDYTIAGEKDCLPIVRFRSTSRVALDSAHTQMTDMRVDSLYWSFDDSVFSHDIYPVVSLMPDTHTVQLIVMLEHGQCRDTVRDTIIIPRVCPFDTVWKCCYKSVCPNEMPYEYDGIMFYAAGSDTLFVPAVDPRVAGDTMLIHKLMLRTVSCSITSDTILPSQLPYTHGDNVYYGSGSDTAYYNVGQQCDSMAIYVLVVKDGGSSVQDSTVCANQLPLSWNGCLFKARNVTDDNDYVLCDTVVLPRASANGWDSTVVMRLTVIVGFMSCVTDTVDRGESYVWRGQLVAQPGRYEEVYLDAVGCDSIYRLLLTWRSIPDGDLWVPNAFTPDENKNNRFVIKGARVADVSVVIFNRLGGQVAHFEGLDGSWDGTCQGQPCPAGAYVYLVKYAEAGNPANNKMVKGTVLLIR